MKFWIVVALVGLGWLVVQRDRQLAEPKDCADVTGDAPGSCAYERCVCTTDPDPGARKEHCAKVAEACRKEPSS